MVLLGRFSLLTKDEHLHLLVKKEKQIIKPLLINHLKWITLPLFYSLLFGFIQQNQYIPTFAGLHIPAVQTQFT
jgi:hypothetical protein